MSQQRRIDLLFSTTIALIGFGRLIRSAGPMLAMVLVLVVAVHGTLGGEGPLQAAMAAHRESVDMMASLRSGRERAPTDASPSESDAPATAEGVSRAVVDASLPESGLPATPAVRLDQEQSNIARFIASRYRTTLETTNQFVFHAYQAARDAKIDPMLVLAVMSVESSFDPRAQSSAGAQGLMQVLTKVHAEKFLPFGGIPAAFDPVANIRVGSGILKEYLKREGTVEGALKSYVGAAFLQDDGGYGQKVLNARERIAAAAAGKPLPPELVLSAKAPRSDAVAVDSSGAVAGNLQADARTTEGLSAQRTESDARESNRESVLVAPAAESAPSSGQNRSLGGVAASSAAGDI
jgi:hypothetical protein